jgi:NAD(P)-dependent dehydrogenase (short-subunit alcohol dehydrogenase family)
MKGLKGRVALVTGATGLLGSAISTRLAAERATVIVTSRELSKAKHWCDQNQNADGKYIPAQLDLSEDKSIRDCLDNIVEQAGVPTIVVANASLRDGLALPFERITHDSFTKLFEVDIGGHVLLLRNSVERLAGKSASFVFLSSIYGEVGVDHSLYPEGMPPAPVQYAAVKAAALGTTRWLAALWGARGVRVNAVISGGVSSPGRQPEEFVKNYSAKTMLRRMASPEEVASAAAFLASDESSYVTGQCLVVDGGLTAW